MMDLLKEFQSRSIPSACNLLSEYCSNLFLAPGSLSIEHAKALHAALPTILTTIFGAPSTRGWIQTEVPAEHDAAIRRVLQPDSPLVKGLAHLGKFPEYSYDVATESLPEDVRKALAAGAIQYLPRLYSNCAYLEKRTCTGTTDIRAAATRQSTIFPRPLSGEYRIKFSTIQFYLYYLVSVATWTPLTPSPPRPTVPASQPPHAAQYVMSHMHLQHPSPSQVRQPQQPRVRSIVGSVYDNAVDLHMQHFIPCVSRKGGQHDFLPGIGPFFLDACIELWLRTPWIAFGQKLSVEHMHFITQFVKFIVGGDLRRRRQEQQYQAVYDAVKDEIYMLISRLALNWSKNDGYLQVISLWALWAAPWRLGSSPRSLETETFRPTAEGWCDAILDNLLFYMPLVEIFLQRIATFTYPDAQSSRSAGAPMASMPFGHMHSAAIPSSIPQQQQQSQDDTKIGGQLRIIYRLINVLKAHELSQFLALAERALVNIHAQSSNAGTAHAGHSNAAADSLANKYFADRKDTVWQCLKKTHGDLIQLGGGTWTPPHLYIKDMGPRAGPLTKTMDGIHEAILSRQQDHRPWGAAAVAAVTAAGAHVATPHSQQKSSQQTAELQKAADAFASCFSLTQSPNKKGAAAKQGTRSLFPSLQKAAKAAAPVPKDLVPLAGLDKSGFLTEQERNMIRQGKMQCTHKNIPALGPRAEEVVRSYELRFMVRWIVPFDRWLNEHYCRWKPSKLSFLPESLTLRPLAATVNIAYLIVVVSILYAVIR